MKPTLDLDFRKGVTPRGKAKKLSYHPRIEPPDKVDKKQGLTFPLANGALAFESRDITTDKAGTLEIEFTLTEHPNEFELLHAFGQYPPLVQLNADGLALKLYDNELLLKVPWQTKKQYKLQLCWDHRTGITLSLKPARGKAQTIQRRWTWQAFDQKYVILAAGGFFLGRPVFTKWQNKFNGSIQSLRIWAQPVEPIRPPVKVRDAKGKLPLVAHRDVQLVELHDPLIVDSPLRYNHIPGRLADLKKTRAKWQLDELLSKCHDEISKFAVLTHHVSRSWPHYHYWPWPRNEQRHIFWKKGHEMHDPIRAGEFGGMCGGYAHVMEELFWSLGFEARRIQVDNHSSFEAWSNQFNKWVICDASMNHESHLYLDASSEPIGVSDLIRRNEQLEFDPNAMAGVHHGVCQPDGSMTPLRDIWSQHYRYAGVRLGDPTTNFNNHPHAWYFQPAERAYCNESNLKCGGKVTHVKRMEDLFWSCQRALVKLRWATPGKSINVAAEAFNVAHPDGFEYCVNNNTWRRTRGKFTWRLQGGVNQLQVRTRNKLGATGHAWSMTLWRRP